MLTRPVNDSAPLRLASWPSISVGTGPSAAKGAQAIEGVNSRSTSSNSSRVSETIFSRLSTAPIQLARSENISSKTSRLLSAS